MDERTKETQGIHENGIATVQWIASHKRKNLHCIYWWPHTFSRSLCVCVCSVFGFVFVFLFVWCKMRIVWVRFLWTIMSEKCYYCRRYFSVYSFNILPNFSQFRFQCARFSLSFFSIVSCAWLLDLYLSRCWVLTESNLNVFVLPCINAATAVEALARLKGFSNRTQLYNKSHVFFFVCGYVQALAILWPFLSFAYHLFHFI